MAAGKTYEPIARHVFGGSTSDVTFSSIPSTYTDLVLIVNAKLGNASNLLMRFNGDTGSNYSYNAMYASSGTPTASRDQQTGGQFSTIGSANYTTNTVNIMNYSSTATGKSYLCQYGEVGVVLGHLIGCWRNTSAITTIYIYNSNSSNFANGSTITLYGIKVA